MQDLEFLWREMNWLSTLQQAIFDRIQLELAMADDCVLVYILGASPAPRGAQSRGQFAQLKRLGNVVVGAG